MPTYIRRGLPILALAVALSVSLALAAVARADDEITDSGADGLDAGQVATSSNDGTGGLVGSTIHTGDATATTSVENTLNFNDSGDADSAGVTNSSVILATSSNDAIATVEASTTADSGQNMADGGQGTSTIVTGTSMAAANVINLVNTNIFNSKGLIVFLNEVFGTGLDLRTFDLAYFFDGVAGNSPTTNDAGQPQCTLLTCLNSSSATVLNTNDAEVQNEVIVRANSGLNAASSTDDGSAIIDTGDAYAGANVVNLVNTNIINSSYLLVAFNNFGNLDGDITLPNADFFSKLFANKGSAPEMNSSSYGINNTNDVDFDGTTNVDAGTGDNTASSTGLGQGVVSTGDAYSSANTYTDANSNYFGGTSAFFLFRVAGQWTGDVRGLPGGMTWGRLFDVQEHNGVISTSTLIVVANEPDPGSTPPEAAGANCDSNDGPVNNCYNSSSFLASSTNNAVVGNNVDVSAQTGGNGTLTDDGTSQITTGSAYAAANVLNLINTNVVGRNWIFALFNVLGDWTGDIAFGRSDLGVAGSVGASTPAVSGQEVTYRFVITNKGDRDADDVDLKADFDKSLLTFDDGSDTSTGTRWSVGKVARGESRTIEVKARIGQLPQGVAMTIPLTATASSDEGAGFTIVTLDAGAKASGGGGGGGGGGKKSKSNRVVGGYELTSVQRTADPRITVEKTVSIATSTMPVGLNYKVVLRNAKDAGTLYGGILTDTLVDPGGAPMFNRSWSLGAVVPGDEITLTYSVEFAATSTPGAYTNTAQVTGTLYNGKTMTPAQGSSVANISATGVVLGASTMATCNPPLKGFVVRGGRNSLIDVVNLQLFLNAFMQEKLLISTVYDASTIAAVNRFQQAYAGEILTPLGLQNPTGSVYGMTMRKINALACGL